MTPWRRMLLATADTVGNLAVNEDDVVSPEPSTTGRTVLRTDGPGM